VGSWPGAAVGLILVLLLELLVAHLLLCSELLAESGLALPAHIAVRVLGR
jgi:hypothetical protein